MGADDGRTRYQRLPVGALSGRVASALPDGRMFLRGVNVEVCDFCVQLSAGRQLPARPDIPKTMGCHAFEPSLERFCSDPKDFVGPAQIIQMATFFGMKGVSEEVTRMAAREEGARPKSSTNA